MDILTHPNQFIDGGKGPLALSIGNFDGVHLGHQAVIQRLKDLAGVDGTSIALTFNNHPAEILFDKPLKRLISLEHRLHLLEKEGVLKTLVLDFSKELSLYSAEKFILYLRQHIPISHLVLGYDAKFGHNRSGTPEEINRLSKKYGFYLEYVNAVQFNNRPISSSVVRENIDQGNLEIVEKLLGRPFSVRGPVIQGAGKGKLLGWPTANVKTSTLCLPPHGVYKVSGIYKDKTYQGIANLGIAPTIKNLSEPLLEVHLFDFCENLYGQTLEVNFHRFIRGEQKFSSLESLKNQITQDIQNATKLTKL